MSALAQAVPLAEHEDVKKVFTLYMQNGMGKEKTDTESLLKHIEFMEEQFSKVLGELESVQSQLKSIEDKGVKATVTRIVDTVKVNVNEAYTQLIGIKDGVMKSFSNTLDAVKEKGVSALQKTVDFLKVHSALSFVKSKMDKAVASLQRGVSRIEDVKTELHTAKSHTQNAGRLMLGKEAKDAPANNPNRGILAGIQKALSKTGVLMANIGKVADSAMRKIEGMGKWKEESSVGRFIKEHRSAQDDRKTTAPERNTER